jgi:hypothetical protein
MKLGKKHIWKVLYRGLSIYASYQVSSFGLFGQAVPEKKIFRNSPIRIFFCLWWSCLLTDWDKMSNLYKMTFHRWFLPSFGSFGYTAFPLKPLSQMI